MDPSNDFLALHSPLDFEGLSLSPLLEDKWSLRTNSEFFELSTQNEEAMELFAQPEKKESSTPPIKKNKKRKISSLQKNSKSSSKKLNEKRREKNRESAQKSRDFQKEQLRTLQHNQENWIRMSQQSIDFYRKSASLHSYLFLTSIPLFHYNLSLSSEINEDLTVKHYQEIIPRLFNETIITFDQVFTEKKILEERVKKLTLANQELELSNQKFADFIYKIHDFHFPFTLTE